MVYGDVLQIWVQISLLLVLIKAVWFCFGPFGFDLGQRQEKSGGF